MIKAWKVLVRTRHLDSCYRVLSTSTINEVKAKVKVPRRKTQIQERETYQHFSLKGKNEALHFPESFFIKKKSKIPDNFYIADKLAALKIINELKKDLPEDKLIMEVNPGIGLLTQMLIDETKNDIFLYESEELLFYKVAVSGRKLWL